LVLGLAQAWRQRIGTTAPFRKVYISRARAARRRVSNEAELRQHLEAQGFETIYLEGMPFAEQVRLLSETATLIANHGAGLTNLMFMQPGTRVTEIRLQGDTHNNCYFSLARAVGVEYHYVLANPVNRGEGAHTADVRVPLGQLP
jgi:capsular polysaccharide biosynthesis protein